MLLEVADAARVSLEVRCPLGQRAAGDGGAALPASRTASSASPTMPKGIDGDVRVVPIWNDFAHLRGPNGVNCYRRLRAFSAEAADLIGPRFVSLDLDCVITADVASALGPPRGLRDLGRYGPGHALQRLDVSAHRGRATAGLGALRSRALARAMQSGSATSAATRRGSGRVLDCMNASGARRMASIRFAMRSTASGAICRRVRGS